MPWSLSYDQKRVLTLSGLALSTPWEVGVGLGEFSVAEVLTCTPPIKMCVGSPF